MKNTIKTTMKAVTAALALTAGTARAAEEIAEAPKLSIDLRAAYVSGKGEFTQEKFNYKDKNLNVTGLFESFPNFKQTNTGLDIRTEYLRLNAAYGTRENGQDVSHTSLTFYPEKDAKKSFIGMSYQTLPGKDQAVFFGGTDLGELLHLEATADTLGNARVALFPNINGSTSDFGIGIGRNSEGKLDTDISYNTKNFWANLIVGEKRSLEARVMIGDIAPGWSRVWETVTELGDNELDKYGDQTFKFNIGDGFFPYTNAAKFLNAKPGSTSFEFRYQQDKKVSATAAYRVGDVAILKNTVLAGTVYRDLAKEINGASVIASFNLSNQQPKLNIKAKVDVNQKETVFGIYGELGF